MFIILLFGWYIFCIILEFLFVNFINTIYEYNIIEIINNPFIFINYDLSDKLNIITILLIMLVPNIVVIIFTIKVIIPQIAQ